MINPSKSLYITCPMFNFSTKNKNSILVDSSNCDFTKGNEYHTSLGDLSLTEIMSIAHKFNHILLVQDGFDTNSELYNETKTLVAYLSTKISATSELTSGEKVFIDNESIFNHPGNPTLWVFGCSHSYGVGLDNPNQRYGSILSEKLNMSLQMIAKPGGSMNYSLRHIMNSCFRPGDLIIWQIINPARLSYFNGKHVEEIVLANSKNRSMVDFFTDPQIYFTHFSYINFGVRYLRALNCNFILTSLDHNDYNYLNEYKNYQEYVSIKDFVVDLGRDNLHFGPRSHANLANSLVNEITQKEFNE